jgi:hypothetical protein
MKPTPEEKCECIKYYGSHHPECPVHPSPSPEARCAYEHLPDMVCMKCGKYEPAPEAKKEQYGPNEKCSCKNGIRGKDCFNYHPAEARVDWEKLKKKIRNIVESVWDRHDGCELPLDNYKEVPEACCYQRVTDLIIKVTQAAFEKGREAR